MDLEIWKIDSKKDLANECVWLHALADIPNIGCYALCDSTYTGEGKISNKMRHMYWFPDRAVSKGDFIRLMTTTGTNVTVNDQGTKIHRLYWGLGTPVWNNDGDCAVLMQLEGWKATRV